MDYIQRGVTSLSQSAYSGSATLTGNSGVNALYPLRVNNRSIEFHDSELAAVSRVGASVVLSFNAAYVHESSEKPGVNAGVGWYQPATLTIAHGKISSDAPLPARAAGGWIRIAGTLHQNMIPAASGTLDGPIELSVRLATGTLLVSGAAMTIELSGEPSSAETFTA